MNALCFVHLNVMTALKCIALVDMMKMDAGLETNARHIWIIVPSTTVDQITWNAQNWIWELEVFMFVVYPKLMVANTLWRNFAPNLVA